MLLEVHESLVFRGQSPAAWHTKPRLKKWMGMWAACGRFKFALGYSAKEAYDKFALGLSHQYDMCARTPLSD